MDIGRQRKHELEMQGCWICSEDQKLQSEEGICKGSDGFPYAAEPTTDNVVKPMEMSFNANAMHWNHIGFTQLLALANQSSLGLNYVPGPEVEFPAAQRHCYGVNVLPGTTNNATYEGVPDFAPVTPEKPARTENKQQLSEMQHLHEEDRRDEKNEKQKNGGVLTTVNIIEINNDKELPMAASESLLSDAAVSTPPPKEKHLSGKEDDGYQIDLNKTPQQKQKRKKHRPKVVKEGKPKTPKPVTPNPATGSTGKRKYVRKNGLKASKTPPPEVVGQCSESKTLEATRKSCRRVLNFAEERPEDKHSTNRAPSSDSDSYTQILCSSGVISKSTVQLCNAIQVRVGNTQADTASELGCSSHQMRGSCMSNPIILDSPEADIRSPNSSNCSTTINLGKRKGAKRKYCHAVKHAESSSSNLIGSYHNSVQAYQAYHMSYLNIPNIGHFPKRKRTEKTDPCDKTKVSVAGGKEIQNFPCVMALGQDARSTKKRSRVRKRVRAKKGDEQRAEYCRKPQTCIDALVTDRGATLIKRKRTKKKNSLQPPGTPIEVVAIDVIIDQLKSLDINKEQNALVLYTRADTVVPYEAPKRRLRAKVDLDEETTRVWKLLLDNINSEGVDGLDEEKIKWWEEERTVFRGRADSFIARMHLVQGDRGFSRWKGSVVDSVVGVFLTQNVSDHLSSSAFMALAAHFPLESRNNDKALVCINEIPNGPVKNWSSMTLFSESNGAVSSTNETGCETVYSSETGQEMYYNQLVNVLDSSRTVIECHAERDGKTIDEDSSQNHVDSSISQTGDKGCLYSETNSEVEDLPKKSKHDSLDSSTLFVELLLKAESSELHEVFVHGEYKYARTKGPEHDKQKQTMDNDDPRTSKGVSSMDNAGASPVVECFEIFREETQSSTFSQNKDENSMSGQSTLTVENATTSKSKRKRVQKNQKQEVNWDKLREQAEINGKREKTPSTMDSLDWDAVRCADVNEIAETIKERGMNHMLAERIKDFLNRLVREHGSIDLEWLRDVPPDKAKEYLLSIRGLGLKSVECVRLLTLHHLAFPVDTNVGRIAVRLGWVPLQPLPESLQLHLLELYPILESIQKYLWPRLCKLDQRTLYELHYQMITFGKVFCTKNKPNCNACPMRGECRHFASAFASARLSLPWPEEKRVVTATGTVRDVNPTQVNNGTQFALLQAANHMEQNQVLDANHQPGSITTSRNCEPIIEEPASPEPECTQMPEDIEDAFSEDPDGIPTIKLNVEQFTQNLHTHMQESLHLQEGDVSKALVAIATGASSIPVPMLKNVRRLRTEHLVYELPDSHALLNMLNMEKREPDDPCSYLLAIWTPGETANSIQLPQNRCNSEGCVELCNDNECLSCNTVREECSQTIRGTLLIPCRTAMRGSFPLNGTYFQVNEVFADHETSHKPIAVPRSWLWKLKRRTVYFGTSVPSIFKGLSTHEIQQCFWRGHVCVRGFDKSTRAPRPLATRLHCPASKVDKKNING